MSDCEIPALTNDLLRNAHQESVTSGHPILSVIAGMAKIPGPQALSLLARSFGYRYTDAIEMHQWSLASDLLPLTGALQKRSALFRVDDGLIAIIADPYDLPLQLWLETLTERAIEFRLASPEDIDAYLSRQEARVRALDTLAPQDDQNAFTGGPVEQLSLKAISEDASPIVRLVNSTLYDALRAGASDIHIESSKAGIVVRYRIDGVLNTASNVAGTETAEQVISRIKVLAELDIAERRIPQDGRFKIAALGRNIDIRVSIMPCIHGEDAVLRILDKHTIVPPGSDLTLDLLGFDDTTLATVRHLANQPYGMLLVTGPTGSGKTTTLYAAISEMNRGRDKIVTIEDPIEYELPGVLQIPVNEKKGLSFAKGLRSILRHDPDKIMVGEIRDEQTAEIAVQSALTGHLVLTTVHANNVFDVFNRFTHMGIDSYALTAALNGVWAQRLLRTVCPRCVAPYHPTPQELRQAGVQDSSPAQFQFVRGQGCGDCRGTGYKGRKAIAEILTLNDRLRELIANRGSISEIKHEAQRSGTRLLRDAALDLVRQGMTTLEEMARVTLQ